MKSLGIGTGALSGVLLTAPLIGVMYLADELVGLPFVPFDLFDWTTRVLPGPVITFGIDLMIDIMLQLGASVKDTAKTAEKVMAVSGFFLTGVLIATLFFVVASLRRVRPDLASGFVVGALLGLPMIGISIAIEGSDVEPVLSVLWLAVLFLAWGVALQQVYVRLNPVEAIVEPAEGQAVAAQTIGRRQFIVRLGAATAVITVASSGLGSLLAQAARREFEEELEASMSHQSEGSVRAPFPNMNDPLVPAPGTRPEYTPLKDHYQVFIRLEPTVIDGADWALPIRGSVENPVSLTIDDIRNNYESRDQYVTLSCISGRVGSDLISTTQWTGVSVQRILETIRPHADARYLHITSGDGFYETVDLDLIASDERIMLCYAWDGNPLPLDHGFPLRIWLPDRYGMKQPKWITGISVMKDYKEGYWVERGWDEVARVETTSVIDTVAADAVYEANGQQLVPVGGMAFAGARGISKVELRVDDGPWSEAALRAPLSETTWVLWRYDWPFESGFHRFQVRCVDGDGVEQIEKTQGNHPSGATGIHNKPLTL